MNDTTIEKGSQVVEKFSDLWKNSNIYAGS